MNFYLAQTFGLIGWIFILISYWKSSNNKIIYLQLIACLFFAFNYYLLGAYSGLIIVIFELLRDFIYTKSNSPIKVFYLCLPFYLIIGILTYSNIIFILPIFASICDAYALTKKNFKVVLFGTFAYSLWLIYDASIASYSTLIAEIILIISNIIVLFKYKKGYEKTDKLKFSRGMTVSTKVINKIYNLDLSNFDNDYILSKDENKKLIENGKLDHIFIHDKDEIIGYISFTRIKRKTFNKIKNSEDYIELKEKDMHKFRYFINPYININTICIKTHYQNNKLVDIISKEIKNYLIDKKYVKGIIAYAVTELEVKVFEKLKFNKINDEENKHKIYYIEKGLQK